MFNEGIADNGGWMVMMDLKCMSCLNPLENSVLWRLIEELPGKFSVIKDLLEKLKVLQTSDT